MVVRARHGAPGDAPAPVASVAARGGLDVLARDQSEQAERVGGLGPVLAFGQGRAWRIRLPPL